MKILAIETSCDETAVCVIEASGHFGPDLPRVADGKAGFRFKVLGNGLISQAQMHAEFGGVFPNLAKREHGKNLVPLTSKALKDAGILAGSGHNSVIAPEKFDEIDALLTREQELCAYLSLFLAQHKPPAIDAIAVTAGPGLEPALWVGINYAKALSIAWDVPVVAVNHMEGHIFSALLRAGEKEFSIPNVKFPIISLLISGGHTELVLSKEFMRYEIVGKTRDDAVGEAFDKVARLMDLPYPGGPEISRLSAEARGKGIVPDFKFTRPMLNENNYDFSFSGLKTAVRHYIEKHSPLTDAMRRAIALEFENTVTDVLVKKTLRAVEEHGVESVIVGGGVSANDHIKRSLSGALEKMGARLLTPPSGLETDNAIMIALAGYFRAVKKEYADTSLIARGQWKLGNDSV